MEHIAQLLEKLAAQLGTTVEYLWKVLVKQAQVEQQILQLWMNVWLYGGVGVAAILLGILALWIIRQWDDDGIAVYTIVTVVILVIFGTAYYSCYAEYLTVINNPEYWALMEITKQISGK